MKIIKKTCYMILLFLPITTFGFFINVLNKSNYNYCQFTIWIYPVNFDALYGRQDIKKIIKPGDEISIEIEQTSQNTPLTYEFIPKDANLDIHIFATSFESPREIQGVRKSSALTIKDIIKINQGIGFKIPDINIYIGGNGNMFVTTSTYFS